jgi:hypothetical protein
MKAATLHACSLTSLLGRWRQATPVTMLPSRARRRHGQRPSISTSSEKLRNVLMNTISPSTATFWRES